MAPLLLALLTLALSAPQDTAARPGAPGLGDRYYPSLGNGGYDAAHYDVDLKLDMATGEVVAHMQMTARATHGLSSFNLDFLGPQVDQVQVDGEVAGFLREEGELIVTPAAPIAAGAGFKVSVEYHGLPNPVKDPGVPFVPAGIGWTRRSEGIYVLSEPSGTRGWVPCNDHPLDKATWSIAVTVERPFVVACNGRLVEEQDLGELRRFAFQASDPMASYLVTVNVAEFEVEVSEGPGGLPLTHYFYPGAKERERAAFARTSEMIEHFSELFGPYPFESFGGVLTKARLGGALETQTLPVYSRGTRESTVAHELAHQWFGNSVSPAGWDHLWLNEGFASFAEWLWVEHTSGVEAYTKRASRSYRSMRRMGPPGDTGETLFNGSVYLRGAWVLYALRVELGDEIFFSCLRLWTERFHDSTATTADLRAVCEEVSERDLEPFFAAWVYAEQAPVVEAFEPEEEPETPDEEEDGRD